jgi:hypothetical protein
MAATAKPAASQKTTKITVNIASPPSFLAFLDQAPWHWRRASCWPNPLLGDTIPEAVGWLQEKFFRPTAGNMAQPAPAGREFEG